MFASHGQVLYDKALRTNLVGPAGINGNAAVSTVNQFSPVLKSFSVSYFGSNLIWSPVRDLDIGVEVVYERLDPRGRVADLNKGGVAAVGGATLTGTGRSITVDDNILARMRIQRDF